MRPSNERPGPVFALHIIVASRHSQCVGRVYVGQLMPNISFHGTAYGSP